MHAFLSQQHVMLHLFHFSHTIAQTRMMLVSKVGWLAVSVMPDQPLIIGTSCFLFDLFEFVRVSSFKRWRMRTQYYI